MTGRGPVSGIGMGCAAYCVRQRRGWLGWVGSWGNRHPHRPSGDEKQRPQLNTRAPAPITSPCLPLPQPLPLPSPTHCPCPCHHLPLSAPAPATAPAHAMSLPLPSPPPFCPHPPTAPAPTVTSPFLPLPPPPPTTNPLPLPLPLLPPFCPCPHPHPLLLPQRGEGAHSEGAKRGGLPERLGTKSIKKPWPRRLLWQTACQATITFLDAGKRTHSQGFRESRQREVTGAWPYSNACGCSCSGFGGGGYCTGALDSKRTPNCKETTAVLPPPGVRRTTTDRWPVTVGSCPVATSARHSQMPHIRGPLSRCHAHCGPAPHLPYTPVGIKVDRVPCSTPGIQCHSCAQFALVD